MSEAAWLAARFRGICAELLRRARDLGVNVRAGQIWSTLAELCAAVADALDSDPTCELSCQKPPGSGGLPSRGATAAPECPDLQGAAG